MQKYPLTAKPTLARPPSLSSPSSPPPVATRSRDAMTVGRRQATTSADVHSRTRRRDLRMLVCTRRALVVHVTRERAAPHHRRRRRRHRLRRRRRRRQVALCSRGRRLRAAAVLMCSATARICTPRHVANFASVAIFVFLLHTRCVARRDDRAREPWMLMPRIEWIMKVDVTSKATLSIRICAC